MFCIKPLDEELIIREAAGKKAVVTFENHSIIGGLGSAVAEVLAENNISVKFKRHGVKERFGAVGTPEFLQKEFRLTAEDLLQTVAVSYTHLDVYKRQDVKRFGFDFESYACYFINRNIRF